MLLLAILSNISLSVALVANNNSALLPPTTRVGFGVPTTTTYAPLSPYHHSSWTCTSARFSRSVKYHTVPTTSCFGKKHASDTACFGKRTALCATAAATSSAPSSSSSSSTSKKKTILATTILIVLDTQFRSLFQQYSIPFPSSLAGCGTLFTFMILLNTINEKWGDGVYDMLNPGATLLAKWLPVFFVPSLITLPLASGLGNALEVCIVTRIVVVGL